MRNRWLIALAAIGIHISIGSVYAWSVLTKPMMTAMGAGLREITWVFSIAILFLGMSAGFLGSFAEKIGPRKSGLLATAFFGAGMLGTALAVAVGLAVAAVCRIVIFCCQGGSGKGQEQPRQQQGKDFLFHMHTSNRQEIRAC